MLKNISSLWRNKIQDTTKEWEEVGEKRNGELSSYAVVADAPFLKRLMFLFTNKLIYRLKKHQFNVIHRNPLG